MFKYFLASVVAVVYLKNKTHYTRSKYFVNDKIDLEESNEIEFKSTFNLKHAVKDIIAFFNTVGGTTFFGINDNGIIQGVNIKSKDDVQLRIVAFIKQLCFDNDKNVYNLMYHSSFEKVSCDLYILNFTVTTKSLYKLW